MKRLLLYLVTGLFTLSLAAAIALYLFVSSIRESHVVSNVPDQAEFAAILSRDLNSYFSGKLARDVDVQYQLLRNQPTQTGIAFPKFYGWVTIASRPSGARIAEGAVRLAARNKASISVTDFVSIDDIKTHPDDLKRIFPPGVIAKIKDHL